MIHLLLSLVCILSVEVFIRLNFLLHLDSILKVTKKVTYVIPKSNISDHWKEKVIPAYALRIMKYSLQILLILLLILSFFFIADLFYNNFLVFTLSLLGMIESMVFAFGYIYLRRLVTKWTTILGCNKNCINLHSHQSLCERWCLILRVL